MKVSQSMMRRRIDGPAACADCRKRAAAGILIDPQTVAAFQPNASLRAVSTPEPSNPEIAGFAREAACGCASRRNVMVGKTILWNRFPRCEIHANMRSEELHDAIWRRFARS